MILPRSLLAAFVLAGAALAACSGNFGAGTTAPPGVIPSGPLNPSSPSPTPVSANGIVTYGQSDAMQPMPNVGGYGGTVSLPVPSPRPSGFDNIPVGVTVALVAPTDAPNLNAQVAGRKPRGRERPARPLLYITLLATRDITLSSYPRFAIDVPRDVVTTYREEEFGLALYNSADKSKVYKLGVATVESSATVPPATPSPSAPVSGAPASGAPASGSPASGAPASGAPSAGASLPPPTPAPTASPTPSPSPVPSGPPSGTPSGLPGAPGGRLTPPPPTTSPTPTAVPTLPPQRLTFGAERATLHLTANKPVVFALYALPVSSPSPHPSGSGNPAASASGGPVPPVEPSLAPVNAATIAPPAAPVPPSSPSAPAR
jgi:hypothetical protein